MNSNYTTDFLTSSNSFITGMGSVLNIGGNYFDYNSSESSEEADKKALCMDWRMVGKDMVSSMKSILDSYKETDA